MAKKKLSAREEWAAKTGRPKEEYKGSSSKKSSKKDENSSISSLVDRVAGSILDTTPAFQKTAADFESTIYTPALQAEDEAQSRALFEPYYNEEISNLLEDLNTTEQMESVSYERTLRRARASLAAQGGAIGTEREGVDKEIGDGYEYGKKKRITEAERAVGTERLQGAGFQPVTGSPQEGSIIREMKANIADQTLWYKNQRANRYYGDVANYYGQSPATSITGKNL